MARSRPPTTFHVLIVESYIWIIPIRPNTQHFKLFGHEGLVFKSKLFTFINEIFNTYLGFDFLFTLKPRIPLLYAQ